MGSWEWNLVLFYDRKMELVASAGAETYANSAVFAATCSSCSVTGEF
jgi:hypothetical protein